MGILLYSPHVSPCFFNCFPFFIHLSMSQAPLQAVQVVRQRCGQHRTTHHGGRSGRLQRAAPQGANAVRTEMQPECWKKHHSWSWLLFIDYLTIMIQTIVHWLLDYYCLLLLPLLFTIYLSSFPIDYSLITLIHYHWWQTLFIVIWNITINWLLFIDYLTIMIDHSLLMIDTQLQYSRCVINNGEEWTQWWCNEVQWDNHEVIWTIVICNQEPTAIEWIVVDNKRQSRTNGELSIKWVIVNKHQVCNQDSTVDIMNQ